MGQHLGFYLQEECSYKIINGSNEYPSFMNLSSQSVCLLDVSSDKPSSSVPASSLSILLGFIHVGQHLPIFSAAF